MPQQLRTITGSPRPHADSTTALAATVGRRVAVAVVAAAALTITGCAATSADTAATPTSAAPTATAPPVNAPSPTPSTATTPSPTTCATAGTPVGDDDFLTAWLTCDKAALTALLTPSALHDLEQIGVLADMTWKKDHCEGAAGSTYCTYTNTPGTQLIVRYNNQGSRRVTEVSVKH